MPTKMRVKKRRPRARNPLKYDPTKTATLRRMFCTQVNARFNLLKKRIRHLILAEDAFGLKKSRTLVVHGGEGSGNFGHAGRPGEIGGSSPTSEGIESTPISQVNIDKKGKLTRDEKGALDSYSGSYYQTVNKGLRENLLDTKANRPFKEMANHIDSAMNKTVLAKDTVLYRGIRFKTNATKINYGEYGLRKSPADKDWVEGKTVGDIFTDKAFGSFTTSAASAKSFSGAREYDTTHTTPPIYHGYIMKVEVPKGTKAIDMGSTGVFQQNLVGHEREILLPRGMSYKITRIEKVKDFKSTHGSPQDTLHIVHAQVISTPTVNVRFKFNTTAEQIEQFRKWLAKQIGDTIIGGLNPSIIDNWWDKYIQEGYLKGAGRAFDDWASKRDDLNDNLDFYKGSKYEFLRDSFSQPVAPDKVKLLSGRVLSELDGVTATMAQGITRELTDGLVQGMSPREVARNIEDKVDGIGRNRALTIARTETIRAHAEGQLDALVKLGVRSVGVAVEWSTTGDDKVCDECDEMDGTVFDIDEARGMIPRHPNCRCSFIPANVGEDSSNQTRSKSAIERAISRSIDKEFGSGTASQKRERTTWAGADNKISSSRPKSVFNTFHYHWE